MITDAKVLAELVYRSIRRQTRQGWSVDDRDKISRIRKVLEDNFEGKLEDVRFRRYFINFTSSVILSEAPSFQYWKTFHKDVKNEKDEVIQTHYHYKMIIKAYDHVKIHKKLKKLFPDMENFVYEEISADFVPEFLTNWKNLELIK